MTHRRERTSTVRKERGIGHRRVVVEGFDVLNDDQLTAAVRQLRALVTWGGSIRHRRALAAAESEAAARQRLNSEMLRDVEPENPRAAT